MTDPRVHTLAPSLVALDRPLRVVVVGCGGTGSVVLGGLPYLDQALRARGQHGLHVIAIDGDRISSTNTVRQPFARHEEGLAKSTVLVHRLNVFFGLAWDAIAAPLTADTDCRADLVIGCVDTRAARATIAAFIARERGRTAYWLDCGNTADTAQVVLGEPRRRGAARGIVRLPTVAELFPEIVDATLDDDTLPSCSALEALTRQSPGVNGLTAQTALSLLARLLWDGSLQYHGVFLNLQTGAAAPMPIPLAPVRRPRVVPARRRPKRARGRTHR